MAGRLIRTALRSSLNQVRYVTPVRPRRATGLTAEVYRQLEREFGLLAPPISLHSPAPATMAAAWVMLREALVATTSVRRAVREAVAAAVSAGNACPYCVEVHGATLGGLGVHLDWRAAGDLAATADDEIRAVASWARDSGTRVAATRPRPFADAHAPQLIAVAVTFHYLNRMVTVFLDDSPIPPRAPAWIRGPAAWLLGRVMRGPAGRGGRPGESVKLLPPAPPDADLAWAAGSDHLREAFGRAFATIDTAAKSSVPYSVRRLLAAELSEWDGQPPAISRSWVERPALSVPRCDQPAARLALLVAKATYQVDTEVVETYRRGQPVDTALVEIVSWAALSAARHAGRWLSRQPESGARAS